MELLDHVEIHALVDGLRHDRALAEIAILAAVHEFLEGHARVRREHAQIAVQIRGRKALAVLDQVQIILDDPLGAGHLGLVALDFKSVGGQAHEHAQAAFEYADVLIPGTEKAVQRTVQSDFRYHRASGAGFGLSVRREEFRRDERWRSRERGRVGL